MEVQLWKDHPELWERFYQDQETRKLDQLDLKSVRTTKIILQKPPAELQSLQGKLDAFWEEHQRKYQDAKRGKLYALSGRENLTRDGEVLVLRAFETDYATLLIKLATGTDLAVEESRFLEGKMMFLGVSGFVELEHQQKYLAGKVAKRNMKHGFWESVPQGTVEYGSHHLRDPLHRTLRREAHQETGTYVGNEDGESDFCEVLPRSMNLGPQAGNCTLIYSLRLKEEAREKVRCSPEHSELRWVDAEEIVDPKERYAWNPVTVRLFEKLRERSL